MNREMLWRSIYYLVDEKYEVIKLLHGNFEFNGRAWGRYLQIVEDIEFYCWLLEQ